MNTRSKALDWFRGLDEATFTKIVEKWQKTSTHFAKDWSVWMISRSSAIIEIIYKETQNVR